jgi:hypothetical protein
VPPPKPPETPPAPPAGAKPPEGAPGPRVLDAEGDDIPAEGDLFSLSRNALKGRLERFSRRQLRDKFGSDDIDAIKLRLDRAAELERQEEERKRAAMTEAERLKADALAAEQRAQTAEARVREVEEQQVLNAEEQRMMRLAEKHIDPDYVDQELTNFAKHLRKTFSKDELANLTDKQVDDYFVERLKAKPKLARDYEEKMKAGAPKPPEAKPLNNGVDASDKPPNTPPPNGKKFAPGNGLNTQQARSEAAKLGYRW